MTTYTNPTSIPPKYWGDSEVIYLPQWQRYDSNGNLEPLVNSAGGLFPKPIVKPVSIGIIHVEMWKEPYPDSQFKNEINATNADTWRGWEPGQAWISRVLAQREETNGYQDVAKLHYVIRCSEFGWDNDFIQMGYWHDDNGAKQSFQTQDGVPYVGTLSASGSDGGPVIAGDLLHRRINFAALGF